MRRGFIYCLLFLSCNNTDPERSETSLPNVDSMIAVIDRYPDSLILRETLIQHFRDEGNYEKAINESKKAITKDSLNARLHNISAILYFENNDTLHAIESAEKTVSIYPDPIYLISLGTLYAQAKNIKALSVADVLTAQRLQKYKKDALFMKGLYYNNINEKVKAISYFDEVLLMNHTFMDAYREKAIALYDLKNYIGALSVIEKAVTLQNNYDEGYFYKGKILEKLNRSGEALENYKKAIFYDPSYSEAIEAVKRLEPKK